MHEQALFERLLTHPEATDFVLQGYQPVNGYRLVRSPDDAADPLGFGVGLIHLVSNSVVFWAQLHIHPEACTDGLPVIHFLSRRKADPELWRGARGADGRHHVGQLLLLQLLENGHVLITRNGLVWHIWQEMLSMAVALGYSIYTVSGGQLSKHNPSQPDREWTLMEDPLGLTLLSRKADLHGQESSIDHLEIEAADQDFLDAR